MPSPHGNSRIAAMISFSLFLIIAAGIVLYLRHHPELFHHVLNISMRTGIELFILSALTLTVNGLFLRIFAAKYNMHLKPKEWLGLASITSMGNYLTPFSGGLIARAAYLKHRFGFPYGQFATMLAANYMIAFAAISLIGVLVMLTMLETKSSSWPVILLFLTALLAVFLLSIFPSITRGRKNRLLRLANSATEGLELICRDKFLMGKLITLTLVNIIIGALIFLIVFQSLGLNIPFRMALLIYLLSSFSVLINVTPGNLGVQEIITSLAAEILGVGADMGLLASLIIRAVTILAAFTLGPIFSYLLSKELVAAKSGARSEKKEFP
jgi:uncharacterized membrane protein YbhN (UPF0104 family)